MELLKSGVNSRWQVYCNAFTKWRCFIPKNCRWDQVILFKTETNLHIIDFSILEFANFSSVGGASPFTFFPFLAQDLICACKTRNATLPFRGTTSHFRPPILKLKGTCNSGNVSQCMRDNLVFYSEIQGLVGSIFLQEGGYLIKNWTCLLWLLHFHQLFCLCKRCLPLMWVTWNTHCCPGVPSYPVPKMQQS